MESELELNPELTRPRSLLPRVLRMHPFLTVLVVAARRNGEYASINLGGNVRQFVFGAVVMGAALFVGGCPTRILIRTGYGDLAGLLALGGVATGIVIATLSMRWVARR